MRDTVFLYFAGAMPTGSGIHYPVLLLAAGLLLGFALWHLNTSICSDLNISHLLHTPIVAIAVLPTFLPAFASMVLLDPAVQFVLSRAPL